MAECIYYEKTKRVNVFYSLAFSENKKGKAVGGAKAQPAQVTQQSWFNIFTSLEPCKSLKDTTKTKVIDFHSK